MLLSLYLLSDILLLEIRFPILNIALQRESNRQDVAFDPEVLTAQKVRSDSLVIYIVCGKAEHL